MAKFYSLSVADVKRETADCVSVSFSIPENLKQEFTYIQGQYVTLKLVIGGEEIRRSYSICSNPLSNEDLRVAIKKVANGRVSTWANDTLKKGDSVEVMTPMGNFYSALSASNARTYVLFAGGSGITPMMSITKATLQAETNSKIILFYANRDEASVIFNTDLTALEAASNGRLKVVHILEHPTKQVAELYAGLLNESKIKGLFENHGGLQGDCEYFICGPTPMMQVVEATLKNSLKIDAKKVHLEYFTASLDAAKAPQPAATAPGKKITSQVTIVIDGDENILAIDSDGPSILDSAIDADLDVPFACKGAVCCTCRAKIIEGQAIMDMNYALNEDEVAQGYILTCQSHPTTPILKVDYDA